jgi:hypothetical protein
MLKPRPEYSRQVPGINSGDNTRALEYSDAPSQKLMTAVAATQH